MATTEQPSVITIGFEFEIKSKSEQDSDVKSSLGNTILYQTNLPT